METFKFLSILFSIVLSASVSFADQVRLYEWTPGNTLASFILPVRASETPEQAAERYLRELNKSPELMELFEGRLPHMPLEGFKPLSDQNRESRALLLANAPKDYTLRSERVENFRDLFQASNQKSYILPINSNLGLSHTETRSLLNQISTKFPFMVAMGGEDVDPRFYRQENFHARNTIPQRDQFEIQLIKHYVAAEKGFLLGICRGSQITSVALGYQLIQDLPFHKGEKVQHANHWHDIKVLDTPNNLLKRLAPNGNLYVNSIHHQSVIYKEGGPLQIAARGADGVVEATEFKNGRGLLLQFHPELMGNDLGRNILDQALRQKDRVMPMSCSKIF